MNEQLKENLKKMLLTVGILSSLDGGTDKLERLDEMFDYNVVEAEMARLGETFSGMCNEDSITIAYEILGDLYPTARRPTNGEQTA